MEEECRHWWDGFFSLLNLFIPLNEINNHHKQTHIFNTSLYIRVAIIIYCWKICRPIHLLGTPGNTKKQIFNGKHRWEKHILDRQIHYEFHTWYTLPEHDCRSRSILETISPINYDMYWNSSRVTDLDGQIHYGLQSWYTLPKHVRRLRSRLEIRLPINCDPYWNSSWVTDLNGSSGEFTINCTLEFNAITLCQDMGHQLRSELAP